MNPRPVRVSPQAKEDVLELAQYIAKDSVETALRFLDAVDADMKQLAEMPSLGKRREFSHPLLADSRSWAVHGFSNHLVFYRPLSRGIEVVRILHGARDLDSMFD